MANARIKHKRDTTANWNAARGFIPLSGELIIYTDYKTITTQTKIDEQTTTTTTVIPGIKIGDGKTPVQDLPFATLTSASVAWGNKDEVEAITSVGVVKNKLSTTEVEVIDGWTSVSKVKSSQEESSENNNDFLRGIRVDNDVLWLDSTNLTDCFDDIIVPNIGKTITVATGELSDMSETEDVGEAVVIDTEVLATDTVIGTDSTFVVS